MLPCGFILSVEKSSPRFLASRLNSKNFKVIIFHYKESARYQNILSLILSSEWHVKLFTCFAFLNMRFKSRYCRKIPKYLSWRFLMFFVPWPFVPWPFTHEIFLKILIFISIQNTIIRSSVYLLVIHTHRAHDFLKLIDTIRKFTVFRKNIF